jgi:periplasmic copper chaperone A
MTSRFFLAAGFLACFVCLAQASDFKLGSLEIDHAWSPATPHGASVAAGYLTVTNRGSDSDRLIGGSVAVAGRFSVHEMSTTDGVSKMRPLADGLEIKPGETVELRPGSSHLMFMDLKQPLAQGDHFKGTLVFAKAGTVDVEFEVGPIGGASMSHDSMNHDSMGHDAMQGMHGDPDHMH